MQKCTPTIDFAGIPSYASNLALGFVIWISFGLLKVLKRGGDHSLQVLLLIWQNSHALD